MDLFEETKFASPSGGWRLSLERSGVADCLSTRSLSILPTKDRVSEMMKKGREWGEGMMI
jgi:hypothetical protein